MNVKVVKFMHIKLIWWLRCLREFMLILFFRLCRPITVSLAYDIRDFLEKCDENGKWTRSTWLSAIEMSKKMLQWADGIANGDEKLIADLVQSCRCCLHMLYGRDYEGPLLRRGLLLAAKLKCFLPFKALFTDIMLPDPYRLIRDVDRYIAATKLSKVQDYIYLASSIRSGSYQIYLDMLYNLVEARLNQMASASAPACKNDLDGHAILTRISEYRGIIEKWYRQLPGEAAF